MNTCPTLPALAVLLIALNGCSNSSGLAIAQAISQGTADFVVLDLQTREFTYLAHLPEANSQPEHRRERMVFRRVQTGSGDIFVAMYEITQWQWRAIAGATSEPWTLVDDSISRAATSHGDEYPAFNLNHQQISTALAAFPLNGGGRLDLPTSSEWVAACGTTQGWWWGSTATYEQLALTAVVRESVMTPSRLDAGGGMDTSGPLPVGSRTANRFGIHDILGNVWEWTREGTQVHGGSWFDSAQNCRAEIVAGVGQGITSTSDYALIGARLVLRP